MRTILYTKKVEMKSKRIGRSFIAVTLGRMGSSSVVPAKRYQNAGVYPIRCSRNASGAVIQDVLIPDEVEFDISLEIFPVNSRQECWRKKRD